MLYPQLAKIMAHGKVSHSLLLTGKETQVLEQAVLLAEALLCQNLGADGNPCGSCPACKKVKSGNHPDLQMITPRGASVKIDQTRAMQYLANLESYEGGRQVVIIHQAHPMLGAAANSLLKFLEEPHQGLFFILTAPLGDSLLQTILSRVVWYRLPDLGESYSESVYLESYLPEVAKEAEMRLDMQNKAMELLNLLKTDEAKMLLFAKSFKEDKQRSFTVKKQVSVFLEELLLCLRDIAVTAVCENSQKLAQKPVPAVMSRQAALSAAALVEEYQPLVAGNINNNLLLSVLFLKMQEISKTI